jgi:hypothetical protein
MTINELREGFSTLLDDSDFDLLTLGLQRPNIFKILGVTRAEIRHSNFLAWLLDANANHGLSNQVVIRFLRSVLADERVEGVDESDIEQLDYNAMRVRREWQNIDILLEFPDLIVCIENKVDAGEHGQQLEKYKATINKNFYGRRQAFVFLTPTGTASQNKADTYVEYSYQQLVLVLEKKVLNIFRSRLQPVVISYLEDYILTIKQEILENDELNRLAEKLYKNHREALDFLFEHRPDLASDIGSRLIEVIKSKGMVIASGGKGFVRFLSPELDKIIPRTGTGYSKRESFLFELDFYWPKQEKQKKVTFRTIIAPGDNKVRDVLRASIASLADAKMPAGQKYIVHFINSYDFNLEKLQQQSVNEFSKSFDIVWQQIRGIIDSVSSVIVSRESELKLLNSEGGDNSSLQSLTE